jgi:hypothetical protein
METEVHGKLVSGQRQHQPPGIHNRQVVEGTNASEIDPGKPKIRNPVQGKVHIPESRVLLKGGTTKGRGEQEDACGKVETREHVSHGFSVPSLWEEPSKLKMMEFGLSWVIKRRTVLY